MTTGPATTQHPSEPGYASTATPEQACPDRRARELELLARLAAVLRLDDAVETSSSTCPQGAPSASGG